MEAKSVQKYAIASPKKMREVVFLIKKMTPQVAIDRLPFTGKRAAEILRKVIMTAVANAKQLGANPEELIFKDIQINEGPRLKRFMAGARGRAKPYIKKMAHIRVVVETKPVVKALPEKVENQKTENKDNKEMKQEEPKKSVKSDKKEKEEKEAKK